jgi:hypothetical protein
MMKISDNPTHVEAYLGFTISNCGEYLFPYVFDYKEGLRNKKFGYRVRIKIPQEVLEASHELTLLPEEDVKVVSKISIETIETEEDL